MNLIERAAEKIQNQQVESDAKSIDSQDTPLPDNEHGGRQGSILDQIGEQILNGADGVQSTSTGTADIGATVEVDLGKASEVGLYPPASIRGLVESEHRRVKRPLLARLTGRGANLAEFGERIMVTSALENEGKTFTAFNLALSLAQERDWEVILIDCDAVRQSLTGFMGMGERTGLLDVLSTASIPIKDALYQTNIPHLLFIPSGKRVPDAPELLSGNRMGQILDLLTQKRNRILLFDSPPLLSAPEPSALAEFVGQILFVVKAGSTQRQAVVDALQLLDKTKAINFVLNQVRTGVGAGYGRYEYSNYSDNT
ncbi:AAA family ATPase [Acidihalobacter aeolianus]|uniref:AAA family ATPase n=1 Tax=Acidihalobacter aeolianus TaxID=2792603 RepID=UPI000AEB1AA1|nr:AAA family ATPase [Acidihalobacter aeolianus]